MVMIGVLSTINRIFFIFLRFYRCRFVIDANGKHFVMEDNGYLCRWNVISWIPKWVTVTLGGVYSRVGWLMTGNWIDPCVNETKCQTFPRRANDDESIGFFFDFRWGKSKHSIYVADVRCEDEPSKRTCLSNFDYRKISNRNIFPQTEITRNDGFSSNRFFSISPRLPNVRRAIVVVVTVGKLCSRSRTIY